MSNSMSTILVYILDILLYIYNSMSNRHIAFEEKDI